MARVSVNYGSRLGVSHSKDDAYIFGGSSWGFEVMETLFSAWTSLHRQVPN